MDAFIETVSQILIDWGYPGLFISALLAGSIVQFGDRAAGTGKVGTRSYPLPHFRLAGEHCRRDDLLLYGALGQDRLDREILQGQEGKDRQDATLPSGERRFDGVLRLSARHR